MMIGWELAGTLGRCWTLSQTLDLGMVRLVAMSDGSGRVTMRSLTSDARSSAEALKEGLRRASALADTTTDPFEHAYGLAASGVDEWKDEG